MDEREQVVSHILEIDRRVYQYLQQQQTPRWAAIDLTMPQLKVLFLVGGPEPMPNSSVARALDMTLSTTTGVVDRLVAQGLVQRMEAPNDRRMVLLKATPKGAALLERLLTSGLDYFHQILDRLNLDELRTVSRALDLLHHAAMDLTSDQPSAVSDRPSDRQRLTADS